MYIQGMCHIDHGSTLEPEINSKNLGKVNGVVFPSCAIDSKTWCLIKKVLCGILLYSFTYGFWPILFYIFNIFTAGRAGLNLVRVVAVVLGKFLHFLPLEDTKGYIR